MPTLSIPFTHLILSPCAPTAASFMAQHRHSFSNPERLWFFYYGNQPTQAQIMSLQPLRHKKKIILLHDDDLLGRIAVIKIACWLKNREVLITYEPHGLIRIGFNSKIYLFPEHQFSLSRFEKCSGFRSQIKTHKIYAPDPANTTC